MVFMIEKLNFLLGWFGLIYLSFVSWIVFSNFIKSGNVLFILSVISSVILYFLLGILYSFRFVRADGYHLMIPDEVNDIRDDVGVFCTVMISAVFGYYIDSLVIGFIIATIVVFFIRAVVIPKRPKTKKFKVKITLEIN